MRSNFGSNCTDLRRKGTLPGSDVECFSAGRTRVPQRFLTSVLPLSILILSESVVVASGDFSTTTVTDVVEVDATGIFDER